MAGYCSSATRWRQPDSYIEGIRADINMVTQPGQVALQPDADLGQKINNAANLAMAPE